MKTYTIRTIRFTSFIFFFLLMSGQIFAATYYVSPTGDDNGPGTMAQPWRTLAMVSASNVSPGDVVYLGGGTWNEVLRAPDGEPNARIIIEAWPGQTPIIDTTNMDGHSVVLGAYTDFIGITVRNTQHVSDSLFLIHAPRDEVVIRDCILRGRSPQNLLPGASRLRGGRRQGAILVQGNDVLIADNDIADIYIMAISLKMNARRTRVLRNRIVNFGGNAFEVQETQGEIRGLLVEGNHVEGSLMSDGLQTNPSFQNGSIVPDETSNRGIVIRNNFFRTFGENAIDLKGSSHIVVERNVFTRAEGDNDGLDDGEPHTPPGVKSGTTVMHGSSASSGHVIIRHNIFFDNNGGMSVKGNMPEPYGWYAYNNTLAGNVRHAYQSRSTDEGWGSAVSAGIAITTPGATVVNNIVVGQNRAAIHARSGAIHGYINHNLYFDTNNNIGWEEGVGGKDMTQWRSFLESRGFSGRDMQAIWANPVFVNADLRPIGLPNDKDFNLDFGSPAIDAGQALTQARSGGSGRMLLVDDAGFFFDGYGVTAGDLIQVGASTLVRIVSIDVNTQTLELENSINWSAGDPVSLPYTGSTPDIGACEVGLDTCWTDTVGPPEAASNPSPANNATLVNTSINLNWTAGSGATSHDVYFGTSSQPTSIGNQTSTSFAPDTLAPNTTYYWRIDEVNTTGTTTGTTWNFTTINPQNCTGGSGFGIEYEGEDLAIAASSGDDDLDVDKDGVSACKYYLYKSDAIGDYVTFDVDVAQAGTYDISMDFWSHVSRGTIQLSINGVDVGNPTDQHRSAQQLVTDIVIGEYTFNSAGIYTFTFTNIERNPNSGSHRFAIDLIRLEAQDLIFMNGFE